MTEMMMKPDEGLADRLHDVRYSAAAGHVKALAHYDAVERSPLQRAAAGELAMSAPQAPRLRHREAHARAGERWASRTGVAAGMLASELAVELPGALEELR